MMDTTRTEALEQQFLILEQLRVESLGDPDPPLVCVHCFTGDGTIECGCEDPLYWPVEQVVLKLRAELNA